MVYCHRYLLLLYAKIVLSFAAVIRRRGGLMLVRSTPDRVVRVRALAGVLVLCSWARRFTRTVLLFTQLYKWVPVKHPIQGGRSNPPSRFMLRKPELSALHIGHLGLYKDFPFFFSQSFFFFAIMVFNCLISSRNAFSPPVAWRDQTSTAKEITLVCRQALIISILSREFPRPWESMRLWVTRALERSARYPVSSPPSSPPPKCNRSRHQG